MRNTLTRIDRLLHLTNILFILYSDHLCLLVLGDHLYYLSPLNFLPLDRTFTPLGLMYLLLEFKELLPIPTMATLGDYGTFYLAGAGEDGGMGGVATFTIQRI